MPLLHLSINALKPELVAIVLAKILGGRAMPFPPFPGCWITFSEHDDGTAIEVYPTSHVLKAGDNQVACIIDEGDDRPTFVHAAVGSSMSADEILALAESNRWLGRRCSRGPFECIEVWLENRLLIEVLDSEMQADYRRGMTAANWASMFGIE